jgi:hypothetical protein
MYSATDEERSGWNLRLSDRCGMDGSLASTT